MQGNIDEDFIHNQMSNSQMWISSADQYKKLLNILQILRIHAVLSGTRGHFGFEMMVLLSGFAGKIRAVLLKYIRLCL